MVLNTAQFAIDSLPMPTNGAVLYFKWGPATTKKTATASYVVSLSVNPPLDAHDKSHKHLECALIKLMVSNL